jgi:hypothetical protein
MVRWRDAGLAGEDNDFGWGIIDAYEAVLAAGAVAAEVSPDAPASGDWLFVSHPNPTRAATSIRYRLGRAGRVDLSIYDIGGRLVRTLAAGRFPAGDRAVAWDGRDESGRHVTAGVYLYRLTTDRIRAERKMQLLR